MKNYKKILSICVLALSLTACSSGNSENNTEGSSQTATPSNILPASNAGTDTSIEINKSVTIVGTGSDSDGTISKYEWKRGSTTLATTASFNYIPTATGTDTLTLIVTDNDGGTHSDNVIVTVTATPVPVTNIDPVANAGSDKSVEVNKSITITGSGSDSDGTIAKYEWKKGSTVLATTASFNYIPTAAGTDTLTLSVTDDNGSTHSDSVVVIVTTQVIPSSNLLDDNTTTSGLVPSNYVQGNAEGETAYLFDGGDTLTSSLNLGSMSDLTITMNIYIDDLKEAQSVLLDSGTNTGNVKLSLIDNRAAAFKDKDVALAFEVMGNNSQSVEAKYRRFMEHEREYIANNDPTDKYDRTANQLWMHLAIRYKPSQNSVDFFINGIYDSTQYFTSSNQALIDTISFGSDVSNNHKFYGKMSEVKIEKKLLTDDEIYAMADFRKDLWAQKYESEWRATDYYYVDAVNGDDSNDASKSSPLKTITAAVNKVNNLSNLDAEGIHIVIKPGLYREGHIKLEKSGSVYKPIVMEAETAGTVTISGSEIWNTAWTETSSGSGVWSHVWLANNGRHAFQLPSSIDLDTEVRYHREILAVDGEMARPYPNLDRLKNSTLHSSVETFTSDEHGFYVDETNDLVYLRSTKNPNTSLIEVGKYDGLLDIYGNYIVLKGITFKHDASFENSYSSVSGEAVVVKGSHIFVEDCNVIDNGSEGMLFTAGSDLVIRGGDFSHNGRPGISTRRTYSNTYIKGINVSYNQWRNVLGHYTGPDLSGFGKIMFSSRIYIENATFSHHKVMGIWFDAHNMDITLDNCYFTQNNGAVWFEISQLNMGLINSTLYNNNVTGVRIDSESIYLKNNVMSQESIDGAWGIISTLYRDLRDEQITPDVYLGKWLTMENNTIAVKSGGGKLMFFKNSATTGTTATSSNNAFYAPTSTQRIYSGPLTFSEWQAAFNDTTSQFATSYPFMNDGTVTVGFEQSNMDVNESQMIIQVPIVLSKAIDAEVTMTLNVIGSSAIKDDDFEVIANNTVTFKPLERKKVISIKINRDYIDEADEDFTLTLSNPTNATLSATNSINITIGASNETLTLAPEKTRNAYHRTEAELADDHQGVNIYDNIGFGVFRKNHWAMYQNVDFGTIGPKSVEINIAVPTGREGRDVEVRLDSVTGQIIATLTTYATGTNASSKEEEWNEFGVHSATISLDITGKHDVYIVNNHDHTNAGMVDWFVFNSK